STQVTLPAGTVLAAGSRLPPGTNLGALGALGMMLQNQLCPISGFGDLSIGNKALLLDCCLMQITFQFKTTLPTGSFLQGLGTGHVSLEPSLLFNINCGHDTYLQGQLSYWIPVGGDPLYQGNIFHTHYSLNHLLWKPCNGVLVIGTAELSHWTVLNG